MLPRNVMERVSRQNSIFKSCIGIVDFMNFVLSNYMLGNRFQMHCLLTFCYKINLMLQLIFEANVKFCGETNLVIQGVFELTTNL